MIHIHPTDLEYKLAVRMQGSSDPDVFHHIFVERQLACSRLLQPLPKLVFDLGANVGYASAFFLNAFPGTYVLAVEPDPHNMAVCRQNLSPYGDRVRIVLGAAWHCRTKLVLSRSSFGDGREWATQVRNARPGELGDVDAWDIQSLLELCPYKHIDLLKIDIEGSEASLFSIGADRWLDQVRNICIEVHGPDCHLALLTALKKYDYECSSYGEYILCCNLRRKNQPQVIGTLMPEGA